MRNSLIAVTALTAAFPALAVEEPDTVRNHDLQEVTVQGSMQRASAKMTTYTPRKEVKNAAMDGTDLLKRMAMPELRVDPVSGALSTSSGQGVTVFINHVQAQPQDMQGLRTADVKSVQYIDYPEDPRFKGLPHVVNITVQEYSYGGYTKISNSEYAASGYSNKGSVFSKFAYRKMVYDLYGAWDWCDSHDVGSSVYSTYRLPSGTVERDQVWLKTEDFGYLSVPVTLRATYATEKVQLVNTAGFSFFDNRRTVRSRLTFSDAPERDYEALTQAPGVSRSLSYRGDWFFTLPRSWSLGVYPSFAYTHNNNRSRYATDIPAEPPIVNDARENAYDSRLDLTVNKRLNTRHTLKLTGNVGYSANDVAYSGSTPYDSDFSQWFFGAGLAYTLSLDHVSADVDAGLAHERISTNGTRYEDTYPYVHVSGSWSPEPRHRFGVWFQLASNTPQLSERSENVQQVNELLWRTGNPLLHNSRHVTAHANYTFLPGERLNMTAYATYYGLYDRAVACYDLNTEGTALVQGYRNSGDYTMAQAGANLTGRFLDKKLVLQLSPGYSHLSSTGYIHDSRDLAHCSVYAQYYMGNFNFSGYYATRDHDLSQGSGTFSTTRSFYNLQAGWGNGTWNVSLMAMNFFRFGKRRDTWTETHTPLYDTRTVIYNGNHNAGLCVSVTYTVGYGRKVSRGDEVGSMSGAGSAIMQ